MDVTASSPVAIPRPTSRRHLQSGLPRLDIAPSQGLDSRVHQPEILEHFPCSISTSNLYFESRSVGRSESFISGLRSPASATSDNPEFHPFSPPSRSCLSRSSSALSSLSSRSTSPKSPRVFSPPREQVVSNDPLRIFEEADESTSDDDHDQPQGFDPVPFDTWNSSQRRMIRFKSSLTASLTVLKEKSPHPTTLCPRPSLQSSQTHSHLQAYEFARTPLSASFPVFDPSDHDIPTSSAVQLQTYSVSLGPPRKPREARLNSDFLRLLALEMEMRRRGKFGSLSPQVVGGNGLSPAGSGIIVSDKVRMVLPRRCDNERNDINVSTFNRPRLKW